VRPGDVVTPDFAGIPSMSIEYMATPAAREVADDSLAGARSNAEVDKVVASLTAGLGVIGPASSPCLSGVPPCDVASINVCLPTSVFMAA